MTAGAEITGLTDLVKVLKGKAFRDVNRELRSHAKAIASDLLPHVEAAVRRSAAPQAAAMSRTVRIHSDRVPVVVVGKVNPKFSTKFQRKGSNSKERRGAMALGVVAGPLGGHKDTKVHENYYGIARSNTWGPLGKAIEGPIIREGEIAYLKLYMATLRAHGLDARS